MGLFDFFKKAAEVVTTTAKKAVKTVIRLQTIPFEIFAKDTASVIPIKAVQGKPVFAPEKAVKLATRVVVGASLAASPVRKIVAAVIPKTIKGKVIAGAVALVGGGILAESPTTREKVVKVVKDIEKQPVQVFGIGQDIGKFIEGKKDALPSIIEGVKKAGVVGGLAVAGAGIIAVAPKVAEKVKGLFDKPIAEIPTQTIAGEPEKAIGTGSPTLTPETMKITPTKKRSKRRKAKKPMSIRQSVKINIINKPVGLKLTSKKYINERICN